jgi:peptide/nickel transport system permease protein
VSVPLPLNVIAPVPGWASHDQVEPTALAVGWRKMRRDPGAVLAGGWIALTIVAASLAPFIAPYDPNLGNVAERLYPLGWGGHLLGTDEQGRDMLSRLLIGAQLTLISALAPVAIAAIVGTVIGLVSAYYRGATAGVLMRTMDVSYAFPPMILAIAFAVALGPGLTSMIIALTVVTIPPIARVAESSCRQVMVQEYILAARSTGARSPMIMFRNVLPNAYPQIIVYASVWIGGSLLTAASLSFLGLGVPAPQAEWGSMLSSLQDSIYVQPGVVILPGLLIFLTSLAFNVLSDSFADALGVER